MTASYPSMRSSRCHEYLPQRDPPTQLHQTPSQEPITQTQPHAGARQQAKGKGEKRKSDEATGDRIIKSTTPITKFLIKEGKN